MAQLNILVSNKPTSQSKLDNGQANGGVSANSNFIEQQGSSRLSMFQTATMHQLISYTYNTSKQLVTDSVSMYGDMTGEYLKQTKIENCFKMIGGVTNYAMAIGGGAMVGGIVGAAATATVQTGNLVYQGIKNNISYNNSLVKANIQTQFNSQRIGNVLIGGGRI